MISLAGRYALKPEGGGLECRGRRGGWTVESPQDEPMSIETVVCSRCGFRAQRITVGGHGKIEINSADLAGVCRAEDRSAAMIGMCPHWIEAQNRTRRARL